MFSLLHSWLYWYLPEKSCHLLADSSINNLADHDRTGWLLDDVSFFLVSLFHSVPLLWCKSCERDEFEQAFSTSFIVTEVRPRSEWPCRQAAVLYWYYTVLYCTALHCTVLYCAVLYCTLLLEKPIFWTHWWILNQWLSNRHRTYFVDTYLIHSCMSSKYVLGIAYFILYE